jgi:cytochrome P450
MKETLRHYPIAATATSRRCTKHTKVGNIEIEKGTDIIVDVLTIHKDKKVWGQDAEEYRPER